MGSERSHVYHVYAIICPDRDGLQQALNEKGIQTGIHYPIPVHLLKAHADLRYKAGDLPVTEKIAREELSLPMYPELSEEVVMAITKCVISIRT